MRNFISEDDIEQAILSKLKAEPFEYDILICDADPSKRDDLNDGTGRNSKKECVLPDVMLSSLKRINPTIEEDKIKEIVKTLRQDYTGTDIVDTNYKLYRQIRNNIKITVRRNGKEDFDFVKLIDFEHPKNNTFTAVCVSKVVDLNKLFFAAKDVKAHGYVNTLVYQTAFDEIESELEKFRCKIYKTKYVPVKSSPISGMMRYFGEDSETKGTDE